MVECFTGDRRVAGLRLTDGTAFCPCLALVAKTINFGLILVQPRKIHPKITEKLLTGI